MTASELQPDQQSARWDDHVLVYEQVFEPFTNEFAQPAIAALRAAPGSRVLDVGAGAGGVALMLAERGLAPTAIDASAAMVARIAERARAQNRSIDAEVMDGQALRFPDATFDAALSVFGVVLFPDAVRGLAEMRRVVRPGGLVAVVTWTEPQRYELAAELRQAIQAACPDLPASSLPAQLRYREAEDFRCLFRDAGLGDPAIETVTATLAAPSARWLADRLAFAPGMAATLDALGNHRAAVLATFAAKLEAKQGFGAVRLAGAAFVGYATVAK